MSSFLPLLHFCTKAGLNYCAPVGCPSDEAVRIAQMDYLWNSCIELRRISLLCGWVNSPAGDLFVADYHVLGPSQPLGLVLRSCLVRGLWNTGEQPLLGALR